MLVTLNPAYRHKEALHALNLVGAKCLVIVPAVSRSNYVEMTHRSARTTIDLLLT